MALKIGLIGIIGEELKKDAWGTLRRVSEIGYQGIEGAGGIASRAGLSPRQVREKLDELGLEAVAQGQVRQGMDDGQIDEVIATAQGVGCRHVVAYWGPVESERQLREEAEFFDHVGERCAEAGLDFLYHNHNHELATFDGRYALDILMENTDPANVKCELDVAWVTYGGGDPVELIGRYAGRCPVLHMKDIAVAPEGGETANEGRKETQFTEVGTGVVDTAGVVQAARQCGVEWLVIEQDRMRDLTPMESVEVSFRNLKALVG